MLHRDIYAGLKYETAAEWFDYISAVPEVECGWLEWRAYEFAQPPFEFTIQTVETRRGCETKFFQPFRVCLQRLHFMPRLLRHQYRRSEAF